MTQHILRRPRPIPLVERIEPLAGLFVRLLPLLVFVAAVAMTCSALRPGWSYAPPEVRAEAYGVAMAMVVNFVLLLPLPVIRLAQVPSPDLRTCQAMQRSCISFARFGGFTNVWLTTDAVHVVSHEEHHVYPLSSLTRVEAIPPRSVLQTFCPIPLAYNLVLRRADGGEVPLFVLAPVSLARAIRRAVRANTDRRDPCLYRQGEAA